ncbi:MAG: DUF2029 domain-containing protein [Microbacteriaceae bacterium]|nr:MAG: DUF2029 domain-containing protein [Microbacteriaceae bacterium]
MTDAALASGVRERARAVAVHPVTLWAAFILVHLALGLICLTHPSLPMGDVTIVYEFWMRRGLEADLWVGIDTAWVYPLLAMVPMLLATVFGWSSYASTWIALVFVVDAVAFAVLLHRGRSGRTTAGAAWWWIAFLVAVGPIALGRIDAFATAVAVVGVLVIVAHPALGGALLAAGAWIKVWPAALVAAAVIALRQRLVVVSAAAVTTALVLVGGLVLGGGTSLFSFITEQSGRGLQIESVLAVPAMWTAWAGAGTFVYYDQSILTYQLQGPGTELAASLSTPLLAIAVVAVCALGAVGALRRIPESRMLPLLLLAFTVALIAFNKVGSPQFATWLVAPILFGIVSARLAGGSSFRVPAVLGLLVAALTQVVYPYWYGKLLGLDTVALIALSARNVLYVLLFVWAVAALIHEIRSEPELA